MGWTHSKSHTEQNWAAPHPPNTTISLGFGGWGWGDSSQEGEREIEQALTVQVEQGVEDLALDLPGALAHAGHPEPLVDGLGRHDVVTGVGVDPPLGQRRAHDTRDPAQEGQDEAQQLQPRVGHVGWGGRCTSARLEGGIEPGTAGTEASAERGADRGAPAAAERGLGVGPGAEDLGAAVPKGGGGGWLASDCHFHPPGAQI